MTQKVQARLIDFNAAVAPDQRFAALHLDIEPHQYNQGAAWPTTTSCGFRVPDWLYWDDLEHARWISSTIDICTSSVGKRQRTGFRAPV